MMFACNGVDGVWKGCYLWKNGITTLPESPVVHFWQHTLCSGTPSEIENGGFCGVQLYGIFGNIN